MQENQITQTGLADLLSYKSKTTVSRILHGQYTYKGALKLYEDMRSRGIPEEEWRERFEQSLEAEQQGMLEYERTQTMRTIIRQGVTPPKRLPEDGHFLTDLIIMGCPWEKTDLLIRRTMEANPRIRITHYMTDWEMNRNPPAMILLVSHMMDLQYRARVVPEEGILNGKTRNLAIGRDGNTGREYLLTIMEGRFYWVLIDGEEHYFQEWAERLDSFGYQELYHHDRLESGKDYIRLLKECCKMEHERRALIVRQTPGIQMLPIGVAAGAFDDYIQRTGDPLKACRSSLVYHLGKRSENFYNQPQEIRMILSETAMERFIQDGVLEDQFYACRPFTPGERRQIIEGLLALMKKDSFSLRMFRSREQLRYGYEAYENAGLLIYPGKTNYHSGSRAYRELFVPGKVNYRYFERLMTDLEKDCLNARETERSLRQLLERLSRA